MVIVRALNKAHSLCLTTLQDLPELQALPARREKTALMAKQDLKDLQAPLDRLALLLQDATLPRSKNGLRTWKTN
jgi:hypothetical protein